MKLKPALCSGILALTVVPTFPAMADSHDIQQLKNQVQQLMLRIDQLEREQKETAQVVAEQSADNSVISGGDKLKVTVSGQINRALLATDDGVHTDTFHVDNDASSTRLRVIAEGAVSETQTLGTAFEVEVESNSTAVVSQIDKSGGGVDNFRARRLEFYFDDQNLGKIWLGKGWTASEDTSEYDLSGTAMAGYSSTADMAAGIIFRDGNDNFSSTTVGDIFINMDGLGFRNRLRYDTPSFNGLTLAVSLIEQDAWDAALTYNATYSYAEVVAALAYSNPNDLGSHDSRVNGSFSVLFNNGFNFTFAAGEDDNPAGTDPQFYYTKLGYRTQLTSFGDSAFSIDYHRTEDIGSTLDEGTSWGIQAVQHFDRWNSEAYLGLRTYELDRPGASFQDVDAIIMGGRIKF